MKPSLDKEEISFSTTAEGKKKSQIKENTHLFNQIGTLAADRDVTVSNTMIKVTYKKALKDQNSVDSIVDCSSDSDFPSEKNKPQEMANLCGSDISFIVKSPKLQTVAHKVFHSTPKATDTEKSKKYVNGVNLSGKGNSLVQGTSSAAKVQRTPSTQEDNNSSSPKKLKAVLNKSTSKLELDKTFLKGNGLVKPKTSIIQRNGGDGKKMKIGKGSDKKIKKLENGVKNKAGVEKKGTTMKGVKRKSSNSESDLVKYKRMKLNDSKTKPADGSRASDEINKTCGKRKIMLVDPDLPTGWTRFIRTKNKGSPSEQYVVYVVNPQGKKFRFKWKLRKYLERTNSSLDVNQFFFGLYQRPKSLNTSSSERDGKSKMNSTAVRGEASPDDLSDVESEPSPESLYKTDDSAKLQGSSMMYNPESEDGIYELSGELSNSPMYDDPNLPEGWKRFIKVRSCGETAGRMEVVIVSPDGRKFRTRKHIEHYLRQKQLSHKSKDFDFSVFGRSKLKKRPSVEPDEEPETEQESTSHDVSLVGVKKKFSKPVPVLDIDSLKEPVVTPEGRLINSVTGLMLSGGLSSSRNERRQRLPRKEHEKLLKNYLSGEAETSFDGPQIPAEWVQRLVKCRSDFRLLELDAAATLAETTKEFIKKVSLQALARAEQPENGLRYEDIAEVVDATESLSFLKTLIPKKITFGEFVKLNRPKQFLSFT